MEVARKEKALGLHGSDGFSATANRRRQSSQKYCKVVQKRVFADKDSTVGVCAKEQQLNPDCLINIMEENISCNHEDSLSSYIIFIFSRDHNDGRPQPRLFRLLAFGKRKYVSFMEALLARDFH